jgi:hypothetical protein
MGRAADVSGPSPLVHVVDAPVPAAPLDSGCASVPPQVAAHGGEDAPWRDAGRGRQRGATVHQAAAEPWREPPCGQGEGCCQPCTPTGLEKPWPVPVHEPGSRGVLPQALDALGDGLCASTRGSQPRGVWLARGCGNRLQGLEMDRLSCPIPAGGSDSGRCWPLVWGRAIRFQGAGRSPRHRPMRTTAPAVGSGVSQRSPSTPGVFVPGGSVTRLTAQARAAHAWTNRELRRLTLRHAPACTAWTRRRGRDRP